MGQQCCTDTKVDRKVYDPSIKKPEKVSGSYIGSTGNNKNNDLNKNSKVQLGYEGMEN